MDINKIPKQFAENVTVGFSGEFFALLMHVGETIASYALTPQHTKRLAQYLTFQVTEYEKKFGQIHAEWKPGIESPIQTKDLMGGKGK